MINKNLKKYNEEKDNDFDEGEKDIDKDNDLGIDGDTDRGTKETMKNYGVGEEEAEKIIDVMDDEGMDEDEDDKQVS